jgi:deoxyribonuclease-4
MYGSHLSISGGMHKAVLEAERLGFDTVQAFTKNQQQWKAPPLADEAVVCWRNECVRMSFEHTVSHDSYLINLASPDPVLRQKSIDLFEEEVRRCEVLKIPYLVTHPGAHMGTRDDANDESAGIARIAEALDAVMCKFSKDKTVVCLESTAGQGSSIGHKLEHLSSIIEKTKCHKRLGVCLDTAHLFAAGYDFRGRKYSSLMKQLESLDLLDRIRVWHLNDSKKDLGTRVDRHDHIGIGKIGLDGFRPIVRDKRWKATPKILETAKDKDEKGREWDAVNLEVLKSLE